MKEIFKKFKTKWKSFYRVELQVILGVFQFGFVTPAILIRMATLFFCKDPPLYFIPRNKCTSREWVIVVTIIVMLFPMIYFLLQWTILLIKYQGFKKFGNETMKISLSNLSLMYSLFIYWFLIR